jgi:hypothetical protein
MKPDEWSPNLASLPQAKPWVKVQPKTLLTEEEVRKLGSSFKRLAYILSDMFIESINSRNAPTPTLSPLTYGKPSPNEGHAPAPKVK